MQSNLKLNAVKKKGNQNMKLLLTDDKGTLIQQWNVENDFGDVRKAKHHAQVGIEVADAIARACDKESNHIEIRLRGFKKI